MVVVQPNRDTVTSSVIFSKTINGGENGVCYVRITYMAGQMWDKKVKVTLEDLVETGTNTQILNKQLSFSQKIKKQNFALKSRYKPRGKIKVRSKGNIKDMDSEK